MQTRATPGSRGVDVLSIGETMALVVPARAERVEAAEDFRIETGGAESNVACHLAAAGRRAAWLSALGDDALGRRVRSRLDRAGVDTAAVRLDPSAPTGLYVKDPGAGVSYYRRGSAASRLSPDDLTRIAWDDVRILHLSGITPALSANCRALVDAAIDAARAHDVLVSFDVNHRPALWPDVETAATVIGAAARRADIVWTGRDEAADLWGAGTADDVRALFPDAPHLVVKDADVEAVEFSRDERIAVPARRVEVVEPVGAGDAFAAGWLDGLLGGADAAERLYRGHAFAARALSSTHDVPADEQAPSTPEPRASREALPTSRK
ncbi:sugar kinase [Microbacterium sp. JZ31]|uniref:sugar kinase n=1 Tax=Microbacterium sp. JZ31 TaxID=1906274 RepID=UPI001EE4E1EA|nr:sugar kinase [Microbacterium sp. JZ31]